MRKNQAIGRAATTNCQSMGARKEMNTGLFCRKVSQVASGASLRRFLWVLMFGVVGTLRLAAQPILFDFDTAPLQSPFPVTLSYGGITANFTATGQGYSIQNANTMGFTPQGFAGRCIYPSSVYLADLLIRFDHPIADFSILYACQELGCDDAATMRVTAYLQGALVGTNTKTAGFPGTWPSDTLACSFPTGFDSVVVHYDSHPPTCQDYGVIFMADNMRVTPYQPASIESPIGGLQISIHPNPCTGRTTLDFDLSHSEHVSIKVMDGTGRHVATLADGLLDAGMHAFQWNSETFPSGVYFVRFQGESGSGMRKLVVVR